MSPRTIASLQACLLGALGLFFLDKIWTGTLFWYINQRFLFVVLAAGLGFLVLMQTQLFIQHAGQPAEENAAPTPGHNPGWHWLVLAIPLLLGIVVPARPLGSTALANKGINTTAPLPASADRPALDTQFASTERNIVDWIRAYNYETDPAVYDGQPADVIGFVYHDSRLPAGQFLVGRFTVSCCVADALGIGMIVVWPQAEDLDGNAWVRVRGPVEATTLAGRPIPSILATTLEPVPQPEQPYLFP
jgi:putative membrane protein